MCLAIPGKIESINTHGPNIWDRKGRVNFGGIFKDVSLAYVPDAKIGDYVIVHVGFALNTVDQQEAMKVFEYLKHIGELDEISR